MNNNNKLQNWMKLIEKPSDEILKQALLLNPSLTARTEFIRKNQFFLREMFLDLLKMNIIPSDTNHINLDAAFIDMCLDLYEDHKMFEIVRMSVFPFSEN